VIVYIFYYNRVFFFGFNLQVKIVVTHTCTSSLSREFT
jgi:hypothetical protein